MVFFVTQTPMKNIPLCLAAGICCGLSFTCLVILARYDSTGVCLAAMLGLFSFGGLAVAIIEEIYNSHK